MLGRANNSKNGAHSGVNENGHGAERVAAQARTAETGAAQHAGKAESTVTKPVKSISKLLANEAPVSLEAADAELPKAPDKAVQRMLQKLSKVPDNLPLPNMLERMAQVLEKVTLFNSYRGSFLVLAKSAVEEKRDLRLVFVEKVRELESRNNRLRKTTQAREYGHVWVSDRGRRAMHVSEFVSSSERRGY